MLGEQELMAFVATGRAEQAQVFYRDVLGLAIYRSPARRMIPRCHC